MLVVLPLLLEAWPGVTAPEVAAPHHLAVEAVADPLHLVLLVDVGHDLDAHLFEPLDELRGRHPAPDHVVCDLLEQDARARLFAPRGVLHFGLCQAFTHRLLARNVRSEIEFLCQFPRDLFGTLEVVRVADCATLVVDGRRQNVEFAVVVFVTDGEPDRLVEPHPGGVHLCYPRLRFQGDVVFLTCADRNVKNLPFDLRLAAGDRLQLALDFRKGAARHVPGDDRAAQCPFDLLLSRLILTGWRIRALEVFFSLGAVPIHIRQLRLVERPQEFLLSI